MLSPPPTHPGGRLFVCEANAQLSCFLTHVWPSCERPQSGSGVIGMKGLSVDLAPCGENECTGEGAESIPRSEDTSLDGAPTQWTRGRRRMGALWRDFVLG